jgi:hypothetical protein
MSGWGGSGGGSITGVGGAGLLPARWRCGDKELQGVVRRGGCGRGLDAVGAVCGSVAGVAGSGCCDRPGGKVAAAAALARGAPDGYPGSSAQNGYDLITGGSATIRGGHWRGWRRCPRSGSGPVSTWRRRPFAVRRRRTPELTAVTDLAGRAGFRVNRFKVVGRMVDLRAPGGRLWTFRPPTARACGGQSSGSRGRSARRPRSAAVRIVGIVAFRGSFRHRRSSAFGPST